MAWSQEAAASHGSTDTLQTQAEVGRLLDEKLILNEALARKKEISDMEQRVKGGREVAETTAGATGIQLKVSDGIDHPGNAPRGQLQLFLGHVQGMNDGLEAVEHALGTRRLVAELGIIPAQADEETVVVHSGHSEYSDGNINFNQMCRFKVPVEDAATQLKVLLYDAVGYPERKSKVGMVLLNVGQLYGHANTRIKQLCAIRLDKGSQPKGKLLTTLRYHPPKDAPIGVSVGLACSWEEIKPRRDDHGATFTSSLAALLRIPAHQVEHVGSERWKQGNDKRGTGSLVHLNLVGKSSGMEARDMMEAYVRAVNDPGSALLEDERHSKTQQVTFHKPLRRVSGVHADGRAKQQREQDLQDMSALADGGGREVAL